MALSLDVSLLGCGAGRGPNSSSDNLTNTGSSVAIGRGIGNVLDVAVDELPAVAAVEVAGAFCLSRRS